MSDLPESSLYNTLQALSALGPDAPLQLGIRHDPRLDELIAALPKLTEADLDQSDGVCPICLVQFRAHLAEEETALAMDSPAHAAEDLGVTRLESTCRHMFCRKDISMWIRQSRNSCPTCRRPLLEPLPEEGGLPQDTTPEAARQMTDDEVTREIQELLELVDELGPAEIEAAGRLAALFETETSSESANDHEYPERSEFGMYS